MKNFEKVIAEASRIEIDEYTGKVFIVFEVLDPEFKLKIKSAWTKDIEFKIVNKTLVENI